MNVQHLISGKWSVTYDKVDYQSPILIDENFPSLVTYKCAKTLQPIGKVYKTDAGWYLSSPYLNEVFPVEVFSKIEGFLLLNNLHKQHVR